MVERGTGGGAGQKIVTDRGSRTGRRPKSESVHRAGCDLGSVRFDQTPQGVGAIGLDLQHQLAVGQER
jgi:hypothetical protein